MATKEDATLLLQILQWGAMIGSNEAFQFVFSEEFDPESVDAHNPQVRTALNFSETVGTLVKQGLLDRGLVHDLWAIDASWKRLGPAALKARAHSGEPRMYENFEALARSASPALAGA